MEDTPDDYTPERRHRQPGRRSGDARAYGDAALAEADDRLFPSWTVSRATKWLTLISLAIGVYAALATFVAAKLATRQEVSTKLDSVKIDVKALRGSTDVRFQAIEARQHDAEAIHRLIVPMAKLKCIEINRDDSRSLAAIADLPCDSLLRRLPR